MQGISRKVFIIASVVIPVYSLILTNKGVSFGSTVLILAIISIRLVAPYFVTLPERCLIDIKEKNYLVNWVEGIKDSFSLFVEIILILYTKLPLPVILSFNLIWLIISKLIYLYLIRRNYGEHLNWKAQPDQSPSGMTKDVLTHQVASIATSNTDGVTLSIFSTLTNVTIYSAFNNLITYPLLVVYRIINGMRASLALKITREDDNCFSAFQEIQAFAYFCVCLVVPVFLLLANKFVSLWIGPAYQITTLQLILCGAILADGFIMPAIYSARDAKGLYKESKGFAVSQARCKCRALSRSGHSFWNHRRFSGDCCRSLFYSFSLLISDLCIQKYLNGNLRFTENCSMFLSL